MMEINLKDKLHSLRQKKNITQETLAKHLGITPQSVGKWERGEGFPDITLLPKIAFYFDITVDELLSVDNIRVEEVIREYQRKSYICCQKGDNKRNLELWEKAYRDFPNDSRVIEGLMYAINRECIFPCPKEEAERIIKLGEKLLSVSSDIRQRERAIQVMCYTYNGIDKEKALYYADMSGTFDITREDLRSTILDGEEGVKACQAYLMSLVHTAAMTAASMVSKLNYSHEKVIEAYTFSINILKLLYSDGNFGFYNYDLSYYYFCIAAEYAEMKERENTLRSLEESCFYAVNDSVLTDRDYTAPLVDRMKYRKANTSKNYEGNTCNLRLEALARDVFDFVRTDARFKRIEGELNKNKEDGS